MILYQYECTKCNYKHDMFVENIDCRDEPIRTLVCPECDGGKTFKRNLGGAGFTVPEGSCGNAANGYSSFHGDSENYKAGRKIY